MQVCISGSFYCILTYIEIRYIIKPRRKQIFLHSTIESRYIMHGMVQSGYLESYNQEVNGKLRKYYCITVNGKKYPERMIEEWNAYANAVTSMIQYSV